VYGRGILGLALAGVAQSAERNFPKVEVAGSSPVPRSTTIEFKFRTSVLGKLESGKKLRSISHTFSHTFPHFSPRLAEFNFSHKTKLRSGLSFPQISVEVRAVFPHVTAEHDHP
jgi:hypothetical protein